MRIPTAGFRRSSRCASANAMVMSCPRDLSQDDGADCRALSRISCASLTSVHRAITCRVLPSAAPSRQCTHKGRSELRRQIAIVLTRILPVRAVISAACRSMIKPSLSSTQCRPGGRKLLRTNRNLVKRILGCRGVSWIIDRSSQGTAHGVACQISAAYSAMVRSLENLPEPARFLIALRAQSSGSAYSSSSRRSASK